MIGSLLLNFDQELLENVSYFMPSFIWLLLIMYNYRLPYFINIIVAIVLNDLCA